MSVFHEDHAVTLLLGDAETELTGLPDASADCCVTSPPYFGQRDYGSALQIGNEAAIDVYVDRLRAVFAQVRRILIDGGTLWLNLGDSYSGRADKSRGASGRRDKACVMPPARNTAHGIGRKQLLGIPWRVALALQDDGWVLRSDIIWSKPNAQPENVQDRPRSRHEHIFMLAKRERYWINPDAHTALGSDVWNVSTRKFPEAHFATFPPEIPRRCIHAGCPTGGTVLDPFSGSGTTGMEAQKQGCRYIGIDINREYLDLSVRTRLQDQPLPIAL